MKEIYLYIDLGSYRTKKTYKSVTTLSKKCPKPYQLFKKENEKKKN